VRGEESAHNKSGDPRNKELQPYRIRVDYCAADFEPCGEPPMGKPLGRGRPAAA
jgi:hypothetical protein